MKKLAYIFLTVLVQTITHAQSSTLSDSAIISLRNNSKFVFYEYKAIIGGHFIGGTNLKPGKTKAFRIPLPVDNLYRFVVYTDRKHQDRHSIEPMDYFDQVSTLKIEKGTYTYVITMPGDSSSMAIKLFKTD